MKMDSKKTVFGENGNLFSSGMFDNTDLMSQITLENLSSKKTDSWEGIVDLSNEGISETRGNE